MNVDLIFKIAAVGILVAVLDMLLVKAERKDQALLTGIAGLIVVLLMVLNEISGLFATIKTLFGF
ncbi:MAG: stage III sporulation protein AC [Oscillospiraceae bacterium]|jgi:stage III sporulation protein AC|nr:stage III sporulation protein AC [Oscillospiraceae bacterium]